MAALSLSSPLTGPVPRDDGFVPGRDGVPASAVIGLSQLRLVDFRNYAVLNVSLDPERGVVLCGPNGAGKSNMLEAVSYLGAGRGLRGAKLDTVDRTPGGGPWSVAGTLRLQESMVRVNSARVAGEDGKSRRTIRCDGAPIPPARQTAMTWLTPEMDRLFNASSGRRRRFLDQLTGTLFPQHSKALSAYERALRERARLLGEPQFDADWLAIVEKRMAEQGVAVVAARREMISCLNACCAQSSHNDEVFPTPRLTMEGDVETWIEEETSALAVEERLAQALEDSRQRDAILGGASQGPHRGDWTAHDLRRGVAARDCSTGEQKALLIALILAYARLITLRRGTPPLLLLDEIMAHLDAKRCGAVLDCLPPQGQFWLTGLRHDDFAPLAARAQFLRVENGNLSVTRN